MDGTDVTVGTIRNGSTLSHLMLHFSERSLYYRYRRSTKRYSLQLKLRCQKNGNIFLFNAATFQIRA